MGNSGSKSARTLKKSIPEVGKSVKNNLDSNVINVKKQLGSDNLRSFGGEKPHELDSNKKVYSERPPKELEKGDYDSNFLNKAASIGVVNVKETKIEDIKGYNPNHGSLKLLKNRAEMERQYEGLYEPEHSEEPNIPARFLTEEQRQNVIHPKPKKKVKNLFGLIDSRRLTDLMIYYKVEGDSRLKKNCREMEVNEHNLTTFKKLVDSGLIDLPTHKVTMTNVIDSKTKKSKQKLMIVTDNWVATTKSEMAKEHSKEKKSNLSTGTHKDKEVLEQFKLLEKLVSRSQISVKKNDENGEDEHIMNRPKKNLVKEVTRTL